MFLANKQPNSKQAIDNEFIACTQPDREIEAMMSTWTGNRNKPINRVNSYIKLLKAS